MPKFVDSCPYRRWANQIETKPRSGWERIQLYRQEIFTPNGAF